jgi:2-dehydro-3-deoxygalactonokinase
VPPALIAVDWGTSALRGALLSADGMVLAQHASARGLLSIAEGGWAAAFEAEFGAWRRAHPSLPCLMAGMVGSRQGWVEAPYCACPAGPADLAAGLLRVGLPESDTGGAVFIVPGLSTEAGGTPDVMRGEETQIIGALQALGLTQGNNDATLVLPGTHSKWATVQGGRIVHFTTHMTGECYALLRQHSILARTLPADDHTWVPEAFDDGVRHAQLPGGLLHHLFSVRSLGLFNRLDGAAAAARLSGLLIGEELRAQGLVAGQTVAVVGSALLTSRYERALGLLGLAVRNVGADAGWHGLASLAARAGLLTTTSPDATAP